MALKHYLGQSRPKPGTDLVEFAACTSPLGRERLFARLHVEERALAGALSYEERQQLLEEPFRALEYGAQVRHNRGGDRSLNAVIAVLVMIGLLTSMVLWATWSWEHTNKNAFRFWTIVVTLASATLIAWGTWRVVNSAKRIARAGKVLGLLARSLYPLRPTRTEIEQTLALLRARKSLLGIGLQPAVILSTVDKLNGRGGQNRVS